MGPSRIRISQPQNAARLGAQVPKWGASISFSRRDSNARARSTYYGRRRNIMRALLDVNVLLALHDPDHTHNEAAHLWWEQNRARGWASCPLSENGFIRISSGSSYSPQTRFTPFEPARLLGAFAASTDHEFWSDSISIRDEAIFSLDLVVGARQLTDLYLLALAVKNMGRLVTFDRRIPTMAVTGATGENIVILGDR